MQNTLNYGIIFNRYIDRGLLEFFGPTGLIRLFHYIAFHIELLATGF
jgi:hypothetical protein